MDCIHCRSRIRNDILEELAPEDFYTFGEVERGGLPPVWAGNPWTSEQMLDAMGDPRINPDNRSVDALASGIELVAYEGDPHIVSHTDPWDDEVSEACQEANRSPLMEDFYQRYLELWAQYGGGLFMQYDLVGPYSRWGSWGLVESLSQDPSTVPKWRGIEDFLRDSEE